MDILVVSQYYSPEPFRIHEICAELVRQGHKVTALTGLPNYPEGKIYPGYRWFRKRRETMDGVDVRRCWQTGRGKGKLRLALNYASFALSGAFRALLFRRKFDAAFVYEVSPITMAVPALAYKALRKTPVRLYCMDLWPESLKTAGVGEDGKIYSAMRKFSHWVYRKCDTVIVASKPFLGHFEDKVGIPKEKLAYMPQHAEGLFLDVPEDPPAESPVRFLFAGNIGRLQNIDCILEAVPLIKSARPFVVDFVGAGSYMEEARQLAAKLGVGEKVVFHGRHPLESMPGFYEQAHAFLLTLRDDPVIGATLPGKLQSYMAASRPVIGAIGGAAADMVKESGCGRCAPPGDAGALAETMEDFLEHGENWRECGANGRRYFMENFTKSIFIDRLASILRGE
jgi:glycosyltransferase involved in cell wall biosynthesis